MKGTRLGAFLIIALREHAVSKTLPLGRGLYFLVHSAHSAHAGVAGGHRGLSAKPTPQHGFLDVKKVLWTFDSAAENKNAKMPVAFEARGEALRALKL